MSSWRDDADQQTQDDLDDLLDHSIRTAQQLLDAAGEFVPFGTGITLDGEPRLVGAEGDDHPDVETFYAACWQAVGAQADDLRAGAVVANVGDAEGDAIAVALEHRRGPAIEVLLPYTAQGKTNGKKPAQKHLYGDLVAGPGTPRVWGPAT